jgi:hypothetical protein
MRSTKEGYFQYHDRALLLPTSLKATLCVDNELHVPYANYNSLQCLVLVVSQTIRVSDESVSLKFSYLDKRLFFG